MTDYTRHFTRGQTPQTEAAHVDQRRNNAGGFSFTLDCWGRLERFLILGAEGGTYYVGERELTRANAKCVDECLAKDFQTTVQAIVDVSVNGRAPKVSPAIFALALCVSFDGVKDRGFAVRAIPLVCRTGSHLLEFVSVVRKMRGLGRALREQINAWYTEKTDEKLCYQLTKYRQRGGMSHRDVFRLTRPSFSKKLQPVARWVVGAEALGRTVSRGPKTNPTTVNYDSDVFPGYLQDFNQLQQADSLTEVIRLVTERGFTHEMIPSQWLKEPSLWEALLPEMPLGALTRNLGRMTAIGLLGPFSESARLATQKIGDGDAIRRARLHPLSILLALTTYQAGHGLKGSLSWSPSRAVVDALDEAFYLSFSAVEPTGKRHLLALDVSGSMEMAKIAGTHLTPRVGSAAMAMVTARTEKDWACVGFTSAGGWGRGAELTGGGRISFYD